MDRPEETRDSPPTAAYYTGICDTIPEAAAAAADPPPEVTQTSSEENDQVELEINITPLESDEFPEVFTDDDTADDVPDTEQKLLDSIDVPEGYTPASPQYIPTIITNKKEDGATRAPTMNDYLSDAQDVDEEVLLYGETKQHPPLPKLVIRKTDHDYQVVTKPETIDLTSDPDTHVVHQAPPSSPVQPKLEELSLPATLLKRHEKRTTRRRPKLKARRRLAMKQSMQPVPTRTSTRIARRDRNPVVNFDADDEREEQPLPKKRKTNKTPTPLLDAKVSPTPSMIQHHMAARSLALAGALQGAARRPDTLPITYPRSLPTNEMLRDPRGSRNTVPSRQADIFAQRDPEPPLLTEMDYWEDDARRMTPDGLGMTQHDPDENFVTPRLILPRNSVITITNSPFHYSKFGKTRIIIARHSQSKLITTNGWTKIPSNMWKY